MTWETSGTILPGGEWKPSVEATPLPEQLLADTAPIAPPPPAPKRQRHMPRLTGTALMAAFAATAVALGALSVVETASLRHSITKLQRDVATDHRQQNALQSNLSAAQAQLQTLQATTNKAVQSTIDSGAISAKVLKGVFTIEAGNALGTAFAVRRSATGGTVLVTNFHVVAGVWNYGGRAVSLKQGSRSISGQITVVRPSKDLASIEVQPALPLLRLDVHLPAVGAPVLVVGSPLGLGGTVTTGVVSAHRKGMIQISAPISPGNSGGPVVDAAGRVVGIASEKVVGDNAEALGFAIPIREVCSSLVHC